MNDSREADDGCENESAADQASIDHAVPLSSWIFLVDTLSSRSQTSNVTLAERGAGPNGLRFSGEPSERSERPERKRGRRVRCKRVFGGRPPSLCIRDAEACT